MNSELKHQTLLFQISDRESSKFFRATLFLFILLFCQLTTTLAQESTERDTLMQYGNEAYQQENYSDAIKYYESIVNQGNEGSILYYNLGNCYYKSGENAKALLWFERALRLAPNNKDIQHNILFVNNKIVDKIETIPEFALSKWWNGISKSMTSRWWAIISIIFSFLLFLFIILLVMSRRQWLRTFSFTLTLLLFIGLTFSIIFAHKENKRYQKEPEAIVMESVVTAKNTPNQSGSNLFVIHSGLKVRITDKIGEWYEIMLPNGEKGWIEMGKVEII